MQGRGDALDGVIEERAADAPFLEAELRRRAEEGLVLADRLALVVVNFFAGADPAGIGELGTGIAEIERTGLGLNFRLGLATEAVGIDEMQLNLDLRA